MSAQFLSNLSQNYIELLDDDKYYDITMEVGEDPNVKIFRAHMNILCYRSPYLRRALVSNKKSNDNMLAHLKLPNISPKIFQIILKYIYGGILSFNEQDVSDIIKLLLAANKLFLKELIDYLQKYLIENKSEWMEQHFGIIHQTSFQSNNFLDLQRFCTDLIAKSPEKVFKSLDLSFLSEKSLMSIIKRDDLQMEEVEAWNNVLKWGVAKNPSLTLDPATWTDDDFKTMENTLQQCLPLIRFFSLHSKDFLRRVRPYKRILNHQLYENLLAYHLDPEAKISYYILPPRVGNLDSKNFDSKIINIQIASLISKWINKADINKEVYLPYKFELLLRGSRDGFTPKKFHTLCDNKPMTVTFIKIKGTEEIIGGYNPIIWKSTGGWCKTKDSFIFSFKNKDNFFKDAILSNVKYFDYALFYQEECGPYFGDLCIDYDCNFCQKLYYEKKLRDNESTFIMEDYESKLLRIYSFSMKSTGGYWSNAKDCFIFSFKNKDNFFKDAILSNVKFVDFALFYDEYRGPCFGDLWTESISE